MPRRSPGPRSEEEVIARLIQELSEHDIEFRAIEEATKSLRYLANLAINRTGLRRLSKPEIKPRDRFGNQWTTHALELPDGQVAQIEVVKLNDRVVPRSTGIFLASRDQFDVGDIRDGNHLVTGREWRERDQIHAFWPGESSGYVLLNTNARRSSDGVNAHTLHDIADLLIAHAVTESGELPLSPDADQ